MLWTGDAALPIISSFQTKNKTERRKILTRWFGDYAPHVSISSFKLSDLSGAADTFSIRIAFESRNYATVQRGIISFNPNFYGRSRNAYKKPEDRETDLYFGSPWSNIMNIRYELPQNWAEEFLPPPVTVRNAVSSYVQSIIKDKNILKFSREFSVGKGSIPLQDYESYYNLVKQAEYQDDRNCMFIFEVK